MIINQNGADAFTQSFAQHRQDRQELAEEERKLVTRDSSSADVVAALGGG